MKGCTIVVKCQCGKPDGCEFCEGHTGEIPCGLRIAVRHARPPCHPTACWTRDPRAFGILGCSECGKTYTGSEVFA